MSPANQSRPPTGAVGSILAGLRRAPSRMSRQSRGVIENAVSQLFDAAVRPGSAPGAGEYRIDDLARLAGTTTRNVRVYRDRGLLHPPLRVGRIALYNDTHLTRLRLVTSMLGRGYTIAHVQEMLGAWEQGKDLGDVLGLESALIGTWASEKPETMSAAAARELIGDDAGFARLEQAGLIRAAEEPDSVIIVRPKLLEAFNDVRGYGIAIGTLVDVHDAVLPHIDAISNILVQAGLTRVQEIIKPGESLPDDTEIAELITMLVRFRTQAVTAVTASLATSIESTIESLVSNLLADFVQRRPESEDPRSG